MKTLFILTICLFSHQLLSAQSGKVAIFDENINPGAVIDELPLPPPGIEGHAYLFEEWKSGTITLRSNQLIDGYPIKVDLQNQLIEIRFENQVKVCSLPMFSKFELGSKQYINTNEIESNYELPSGIAQVLYEGKVAVINHLYTEMKEPTYVPTVDMGDRNKKIIKKEQVYAIKDKTVFELNGKLKRNQDFFGNNYKEVADFAEKNKLKFKDQDDLIAIIKFYNSLL